MPTHTPERSVEQRNAALRKANATRLKRADWKKRVKHHEEDPFAALVDPPAELASMRVYDWLRSMPMMGKAKADRILRMCGISAVKTLGDLSERQRCEISTLLGR
jgi:hypothetical protein